MAGKGRIGLKTAVLFIVALLPLALGVGTALADSEPERGRSSEAPAGNEDERGTASRQQGDEVTEDNDSDNVPNTPDPEGDDDNRHPSGKDKHAEAGGSGNQGASASTPDQDGHGPERDEGGTDKPDGPGGLDILDQDGNNGCGNDDDFEDDNEGLCLGRAGAVGNEEEEQEEEEQTEVGGVASETGEQASVLGVQFSRPGEVMGAQLGTTGAASMMSLLTAGFALATMGLGARIASRRRR